MAINVSQSFHRTSANAVDDTLTLTKAQMKTVNDNLMPSKYMTICQDDGEIYVYDKSATASADTGKFKKYGGGHAIEDDQGTTVTQRDVMQFGDGFDVSDDSTNEKTIVEPSLMSNADMDDVVTPLPGVQTRYHEYSTTEQVVGKWIDGKTVYERSFKMTSIPHNESTQLAHSISNFGELIDFSGTLHAKSTVATNSWTPLARVQDNSTVSFVAVDVTNVYIQLKARTFNASGVFDFAYITIRYTKTT